MERFEALWQCNQQAFSQHRTWAKARVLAISALACLGRHTITGLLTTSSQIHSDWTGAYRLFERDRIEWNAFWRPVRQEAIKLIDPEQPVVAIMDDTLLAKRGRKVQGTAWHRDPLGPKFNVNLIWAQRFLEIVLAVPTADGSARAIPIDLQHCPGAKKPGKRATDEQIALYNKEKALLRIPLIAVQRLHALRQAMDDDLASSARKLIVAFDGGYTNTTTFRKIPERTTLIGRIRKDAALFKPPPPKTPGCGRHRVYGERLPTPESMREDKDIHWQIVHAHAAGRMHDFSVKVVDSVRWRGAGAKDLRLIIIRPLAYRPTQSHRVLYREPAYLLCSDMTFTIEQMLQAYLWRWEIEPTFQDEKTLLGMGEAQVWSQPTVANVPAFFAGIYAYFHLAALQAGKGVRGLPRPKWQQALIHKRITTGQLQGVVRTELWGKAMGVNLTDFMQQPRPDMKSVKFPGNPFTAIAYAIK